MPGPESKRGGLRNGTAKIDEAQLLRSMTVSLRSLDFIPKALESWG
jgi:hypothetical protein